MSTSLTLPLHYSKLGIHDCSTNCLASYVNSLFNHQVPDATRMLARLPWIEDPTNVSWSSASPETHPTRERERQTGSMDRPVNAHVQRGSNYRSQTFYLLQPSTTLGPCSQRAREWESYHGRGWVMEIGRWECVELYPSYPMALLINPFLNKKKIKKKER